MPQWRKLHVKAVESLDLNDMPDDFTRLLWIMLPLGLDREGRGLDNAAWVKAKIMPLRLDVVPERVAQAMDWYAERGMIVRYQVDERRFFHVPTFARYQGNTSKEAESDYPPPPDLVESSSRVNGMSSQEQVESSSRPTPDLLQSNSSTDVDADADTDSDSEGERACAVQPPASEGTERGADAPPPPAQAPKRRRTRRAPTPTPAIGSEGAITKEHPAIAAYHAVTGRYPPKQLWQRVAEGIRLPIDMPRMRQAYEEWIARGYNRENLAWLFEWYGRGRIPAREAERPAGRGGARASPEPWTPERVTEAMESGLYVNLNAMANERAEEEPAHGT